MCQIRMHGWEVEDDWEFSMEGFKIGPKHLMAVPSSKSYKIWKAHVEAIFQIGCQTYWELYWNEQNETLFIFSVILLIWIK